MTMKRSRVGEFLMHLQEVGKEADAILNELRRRGKLRGTHPAHYVAFSHVNTERMTLVYRGSRQQDGKERQVALHLPLKCLWDVSVLESIIAKANSQPSSTPVPVQPVATMPTRAKARPLSELIS